MERTAMLASAQKYHMKRMGARVGGILFEFGFSNEDLKLARLRSEFMTVTNKIM